MPYAQASTPEVERCTVNMNGVTRDAIVLQRRPGELYVHFEGTDRRMDEWVSEEHCTTLRDAAAAVVNLPPPGIGISAATRRKRRREDTTTTTDQPLEASSSSTHQTRLLRSGLVGSSMQTGQQGLSEDEQSTTLYKRLTAKRNFEKVIFDEYMIKPWYYSPYPLTECEEELPNSVHQKVPGVSRATTRAYGRTSDLLSGGLQRQYGAGSTLWVCHFCFKYMVDGALWELHKKDCKLRHPPGGKVYQRGAHTIWEVDGAKEKLYCQNLSLFGKLFIDVKTLFFDCDNFLFYILTDAKSSEDHILGFFSKEKLSYDDYNLACIMTLPQYQRKGYGMLMIEFSYELSRRAGIVGTPERPLSDLGLRSYLAYWISILIRFFRRVLSVLPPDVMSAANKNSFPQMESNMISGDVERISMKRVKKSKGFDGEVNEGNVNAEASLCMMPLKDIPDPTFTMDRVFETTPNDDGGADTNVKVECTLANIAAATNLRIDDAAFALNECGLLMRRLSSDEDDESKGQMVLITRRLVEKVAKERNIKRMYLDMNCVIP